MLVASDETRVRILPAEREPKSRHLIWKEAAAPWCQQTDSEKVIREKEGQLFQVNRLLCGGELTPIKQMPLKHDLAKE